MFTSVFIDVSLMLMFGAFTDLDLRLVRVFLAVVDAGGVSAAQQILNVGQSTISTRLATLETRLGYRLCERGRSGFRLTAKGERFADLARSFIGSIAQFGAEARNLDRKLVGVLRLGMIGNTPLSENARVSEAIARFRERDEAVRLSVRVCPPAELEDGLLRGDLDIAVGYFWHRAPTLHFTPLFSERHFAYCAAGHPLFARSGTLSAAEVADHGWAWRTYPLPEARMSAAPRRVIAVADNMEAVAMLVLSGRHLGFLPAHFAAPLVAGGMLAALNPDTLHYEVVLHVVSRQIGALSEIVRAFLEDIHAVHGIRA